MSAFVIYEHNEEIKFFEGDLPPAEHYPSYTYGYKVEKGEWFQVRTRSMNKGQAWVDIDPDDKTEGVPKTIRAAILLLGG
jgi:hypothetical protein